MIAQTPDLSLTRDPVRPDQLLHVQMVDAIKSIVVTAFNRNGTGFMAQTNAQSCQCCAYCLVLLR